MPYNPHIYARVRRDYDSKYLVAREEADARRTEVHTALPAVEALDRELKMTGLSIMGAALQGGDVDAKIEEVRAHNAALRARRAALLVANGYPADYTEVRYECAACADSGFLDNGTMCPCMRRRLIEETCEASGIGELLRTQTFESFDLSYYESDENAHRRMTQILSRMKQFAETFAPGQSESLVLFGGTGLGKTHLSTAVARTVIERGHDVLYISAVGLLADFELQRFGNRTVGSAPSEGDTARYYDCDLLIIDDLGTEVANQFTTSVLYDLLNTRILRRRSTVMSTNLTQDEFRRRYWDRITSRVLGEFTVLPFLGKDIRAQKLNRR